MFSTKTFFMQILPHFGSNPFAEKCPAKKILRHLQTKSTGNEMRHVQLYYDNNF